MLAIRRDPEATHQLTFALPRAGEGSHTITKTHKVTVRFLLSLCRGFFHSALGLLLDACVVQTFQSPVCSLSAETTKASRLPRRARHPSDTRPFALTSASLRATRAVPRYQGDPVSSCTDLNVTTLSAARPSYFSTWRVVFFEGERKGGGAVLALGWVSFSPCLFQMLLPRCLERRGWVVCRHTCARPGYQPLQAGQAGGRCSASCFSKVHTLPKGTTFPLSLGHT